MWIQFPMQSWGSGWSIRAFSMRFKEKDVTARTADTPSMAFEIVSRTARRLWGHSCMAPSLLSWWASNILTCILGYLRIDMIIAMSARVEELWSQHSWHTLQKTSLASSLGCVQDDSDEGKAGSLRLAMTVDTCSFGDCAYGCWWASSAYNQAE